MIGSRKQPAAQSQHDINDAVRFNAFSLEKQQENKVPLVSFLIFLINLIAVIFDSLLHANLGRDYVNPISYLWGFFKGLISFFNQGGLAFIVVVSALIIGYFKFSGHPDAFNIALNFFKDIYYSNVIRLFFGVGFLVMIVQAVFAFLTFSKTKRFSYSNGTPWLYYITRIPFFKDSNYILYIEPTIIVSSSLALYIVGYEGAEYITFFGLLYLIRNIYVYSIMDKGNVQRNDMEVKAIAENISQLEQPSTLGSRTTKPASTKVDEIDDFIE